MKHTITITRQEFLLGNYGDSKHCPCAVALKRTFPEAEQINVTGFGFSFIEPTLGSVDRSFKSCEVTPIDYMTLDPNSKTFDEPGFLEDAICDMACYKTLAQDLTFNFITV